uniref:N-acetyltransferase domain-containing protein n=1 Tax=Chromera velia CCMP2878 TaxID=1169474 RepID=A0A0G4IA05_9ALVE|eukprot:Cvel_12409.t1-p1 / transcript=Cvel_12409.t1 / gene=Cvel_12409 / organism=Chromera_velia_CCMP2878 / gene_product=N-alpha-acetyltransferase 30, putative / transcript_product=N-alpha-acetyltransferase 30, putative / location=Cvel_scaffold811:58618-61530(-) / protein_length=267 / sequence_SO=supercontig / SO=protein_coding / is_pseudo=false
MGKVDVTIDHGGTSVRYTTYAHEGQLSTIMELLERDLSEPYSIFTYRAFLEENPELTLVAEAEGKIIGVVMCKMEMHKARAPLPMTRRCYLGMIAVEKEHRRLKIGAKLVEMVIEVAKEQGADEMVLETEFCNKAALGLYRSLGFIAQKHLRCYYLNNGDAVRLKLPLTPSLLYDWHQAPSNMSGLAGLGLPPSALAAGDDGSGGDAFASAAAAAAASGGNALNPLAMMAARRLGDPMGSSPPPKVPPSLELGWPKTFGAPLPGTNR